MYTIKLSNGTRLENLVLNGNNFISETIIPDSAFEGGLDTVIISDGQTEKSYSDMFLMNNRIEDGKTWFIFAEKTEEQKKEEAIRELEAKIASQAEEINLLNDTILEVLMA